MVPSCFSDCSVSAETKQGGVITKDVMSAQS